MHRTDLISSKALIRIHYNLLISLLFAYQKSTPLNWILYLIQSILYQNKIKELSNTQKVNGVL